MAGRLVGRMFTKQHSHIHTAMAKQADMTCEKLEDNATTERRQESLRGKGKVRRIGSITIGLSQVFFLSTYHDSPLDLRAFLRTSLEITSNFFCSSPWTFTDPPSPCF